MQVKRNAILVFIFGASIIAALACSGTAPTEMPDTQATVDAAIAATGTAQVSVQTTIAAAVDATGVAAQATSASTAAPSPTPSAEYVTMTEEELAALIDQAVVEAATSTQQCSDAATAAAADDEVAPGEAETVEAYLVDAEEAIAYAEELISVYYDLYGELATETLVLLQAVEQDLALLAENAAEINVALQEIDATLQQGLALAEETITQLETAAQAASVKAVQIQAQTQGVLQQLQIELEGRAAAALSVPPNSIATDRRSALLSAFDYVDAVREAQADGRISQTELTDLAQLGANASASLQTHGGPQLQRLSGSIDGITGQIARGQLHQVEASLGSLEASLGARPSRP